MRLLLALLLTLTPARAEDPHARVRGITVSCPTWGWEWGSDAMVSTLDELVSVGANWVAIHPYARVGRDGSVDHRLDPDHPPDWLTRPIREAHARGLKVLIKPHLAYWGSGWSWRGEIAFDDAEARARFFREYTAFVTALARASSGADAFVVGTELEGTTHHEASWRRVVAAVRPHVAGPISYAANWDRIDRVPFWDAVDVIGVQAYFPLLDEDDPVGVVPDRSVLEAAWDRVRADVRPLAERTGKPVVFTELGYDRSVRAGHAPWDGGQAGPAADAVQLALLDAALEELSDDPLIRGAFLWKWMPGEAPVGDFRLSRDAVRAVIASRWR